MHRLWIDYIEKALKGKVLSQQMANTKIDQVFAGSSMDRFSIDYMSSLYHFAVKPDGETLYYWAKYTGLFPSSLPWDIFSTDDGNVDVIKSIPITYNFTYKEDMNLSVLKDFNKVARGTDLQNISGNYWDEHNPFSLGEGSSDLAIQLVDPNNKSVNTNDYSAEMDRSPRYKLFIKDGDISK